MVRRRKKRASGTEASTGVAALGGLFTAFHPAVRHDIERAALPVGLIVLALAGLLAAIMVYLRADRRRQGEQAVATPSKAGGASEPLPSTPSRSAFDPARMASTERWTRGGSAQTGPRPTTWSLELLRQLEWKRFEELCAAYFEAVGGFKARATPLGADGGVDIYLYSPGAPRGAPTSVVQCKAWHTYKVGVKPVRELYGVMVAERARTGIFMATGDYTDEARAFAADKHVQLVSGEDLLEKLKKVFPSTSQRLLEQVTAGDYTTPTCPQCGVKMTLRTSNNDDHVGQRFWGCVNYPRCRQTLKLATQLRNPKL